MPTTTDYARLAMALDCEGTIDIHTHRQFYKHLGKTYETKYVRLMIGNTDFRLPLWCKKTFGGTASPDTARAKRRPEWSPFLVWYLSSKKAADLLRHCLPYFVVKREQANVALAFQETKSLRFGCKGHPAATHARRVELQNKLVALRNAPNSEMPSI